MQDKLWSEPCQGFSLPGLIMSADINCYHFRYLFRMFIISVFVVANLIRLSSAWNATFLPLGDSITYVSLLTDGNGYREDLLELITARGNLVDYIGSIQAGTMADNWNNGYIRCTIDQIASSGIPALKMVVLLMAGTNDINYQEDLANAPTRLMNLPNTAVIVSDIPLIADDTLEPLVETYNSGVQELLQERISEGQHIVHVTLSDLTSLEMADDLHPSA
ncbi:hypothetical protein DFJ43DRAFT_1054577 [Lentinula guzmanii]|uniref:SGNH hydrolase-type esterase domain-containing protein n=1 Tax=Lentinula guzmanii TaxID=2804957 RepID=A0AA38JUJ1_9AGAR|nr:hypothetical protein DFJ43DRAFT_1054577 [Lentinula guzmanii]